MRSSALLCSVMLALACAPSGSDPETAHDAAWALRAAYGEHAAEVLDRQPRIARDGDSFELAPVGAPLRVSLPDDARDAIEMRVAGRVVRVREPGLRGRAERIEGAISYACDGGRAYWTEGDDASHEEWIELEAGRAHAGRELARWYVEDARLRAHDGAVLIADAAGDTLLRVSAPRAWARSGRAVRATLGIDGSAITLEVDADGEAVLVDPMWVATGAMTTARSNFLREHGVVVLPTGRALVVGGIGAGAPLASAERYDPTTGTWSSAGTMSAARDLHTTTVLADGRVLVAGGSDGSADLASAEIYDPVTNAWSAAAAMSRARSGHGATLLASGRVLVTGGYTPDLTSTAELYDPATNTWSAAASMPDARAIHTATRLPTGRVLVTGGDALAWLTGATVYDPAINTWSPAGAMSSARTAHAATLLADGRVLVTGGSGPSGGLSGAEIYDPIANTWTPTGSMSSRRWFHTATSLIGGRVLAAGGRDTGPLSTTEIYDPATGTWSAGPSTSVARERHAAARLANGRVLIAGGRVTGGSSTAGVELLTSCGDGVVDADEACDDGNTVAGDCCSPTCALEPATTVCRASTCTDGVETPAATCSGTSAACPPAAMQACAPFACGDGACLSACGGDGDCALGHHCAAGTCAPNPDLGTACTSGAECSSDECVDGVCCESACDGQCEACDVAGSEGSCVAVVGAPRGGRAPCAGEGPCAGECDGSARGCVYPGAGEACGEASCADGVATPAGTCDGAGTCSEAEATGCAPYACGASACLDACATDEDCAADFACSAGECREATTDGGASDGGAVADAAVLDGGVLDGGVLDGGAPGAAPAPGGCSCAAPGATRGPTWSALAALALAIGLRRRTRRSARDSK